MSFADGGPLPAQRFNVVLCGAAGVGKTTFVRAFVAGEEVTQYRPTVGMAYELWNGFPDSVAEPRCELQLHMWDLGGAPQYRASQQTALQGADLVLGVYDTRAPDSLTAVQRDCAALQCPVWLVGTHAEHAATVGDCHMECCATDPRSVRECLQPVLLYLYTLHEEQQPAMELLADDDDDDGYYRPAPRRCCRCCK